MRKYLVAVLLLSLASAALWFLFSELMEPRPQARPLGSEIRPEALRDSGQELPGSPRVESARSLVDASSGALRVSVRWQHDSRPAVGVAILLAPGIELGTVEWREVGATDPQGQLLLGPLDPGPLTVRPEFFEPAEKCMVRAGATSELDFELPPRTNVHGLVVDREGHPVSGAEIWLSQPERSTVGTVVAHSDPTGSFSTAFYGESRCIAARAHTVGVSSLVPVRADAESLVDVRLVLDGDAAQLEGDVVDEQGNAVHDANVFVGSTQDFGQFVASVGRYGDVAHLQFPPPSVQVRTDRAGHFLAANCTTGRLRVTVWASGFGPWQQAVAIEKDVPNRIRVVLDPEAVISGIVRDSDGKPVPNVVVSALPSAFGAPPEQPGPWQSWTSRSDAQGAYDLQGLPAGDVRVSVTDQQLGSASSQAHLVAGQHLVLDLVLDRGTSLNLSVRDRDGAPLVGWSVQIHAQGSNPRGRTRLDSRRAETDSNGRIAFAHCLLAPYDVQVSPGGAVMTWVVLRKEGLHPGPTENVLVVEAPVAPRAFIRGVVHDPSGHTGDCVVNLTHIDAYARVNQRLELPAQPLAVGPLFDGSYDLTIKVKGCVPLKRQGIKIEAGRDVDLGVLTAEPAGEMTVQLIDSQGEPCGAERVWLVGKEEVKQVLNCSPQRPARFKDVVPGNYDVTAFSDLLGLSTAHIVVAGNKENSLLLRLPGGVPCEFRIDDHGRPFRLAEIFWRDAAGALLGKESYRTRDHESVIRRTLPPGRYRIEVRGIGKPVLAATDFVVSDPMPGPVLVDLHTVSREEWLRSFTK